MWHGMEWNGVVFHIQTASCTFSITLHTAGMNRTRQLYSHNNIMLLPELTDFFSSHSFLVRVYHVSKLAIPHAIFLRYTLAKNHMYMYMCIHAHTHTHAHAHTRVGNY